MNVHIRKINSSMVSFLGLIICIISFINCADANSKKKKVTSLPSQGADAKQRSIDSFTASPPIIPLNYSGLVTLSWQTTGIDHQISLSEIGAVEPNGFRTIETPQENKEYILSVSEDGDLPALEQRLSLVFEEPAAAVEPVEIIREETLPTLGQFVITDQIIAALDGTRNYRFQLGDFNGDKVFDLYVLKISTAPELSTLTILDGSKNFSIALLNDVPLLRSWPDNQAFNFDVIEYDHDAAAIPDLMFIKKYATGTNKVEVFANSGKTETLGQFLSATGSVADPVDPSVTGAFLITSDPNVKPHLVLVGNKLEADDKYRYRIIDSRNTCDTDECKQSYMTKYQGYLFPGANAQAEPIKLLDSNSLYSFTTYDFNRDGTSDLIALRYKGSERKVVEISVYDGVSLFRNRIVEFATQLAHRDTGANMVFNTYQDTMAVFIFYKKDGKWVMTIYKL